MSMNKHIVNSTVSKDTLGVIGTIGSSTSRKENLLSSRIKSNREATISTSNITQAKTTFNEFEKRLINHKDLVSVDFVLPVTTNKNVERIPFKKTFKNNEYFEKYNKHIQNLTIPEMPRERKPIDITKNIIEQITLKEYNSVKIQSDQLKNPDFINEQNSNTNNFKLNKFKANKDDKFNLYNEKNCKIYVEDTPDIDYTHNIRTDNYIKQKTGKDAATWIDYEEIFCFDVDVEPILTVLTNKILEQTLLELSEEYEIKKIRETKLKFMKKIQDEKARVKKVELEEINRKKEMDLIKMNKQQDRIETVILQQKIFARVMSKKYLTNLIGNTKNFLAKENVFNNFDEIQIKELALMKTTNNSNKMEELDEIYYDSAFELIKSSEDNEFINHKLCMLKKREEDERKRLEEIERQKRLEEEKELARIARENRRNQKRLDKLKNDIKTNILKTAKLKNEYHQEDVFGIDGVESFASLFPNEEDRNNIPTGKLIFI